MTEFDEIELSVCEVCIHLLANGDYNNGTDDAEIAGKGIERIWGTDAQYLVPGNDSYGFCVSSCDMCGSTDHGDRFQAAALMPKGQ